MPYIYSLGYRTWLTGAPFMRALPLDFPNDPKVADLRDEYMFGPAFLVAPVTEQGATSRQVYLPAGADWYNYWTQERVKGGQTITVQAPIDTIPLFVQGGFDRSAGAPVESTHEAQPLPEFASIPARTRASRSFPTTARPTPTRKALVPSPGCTGTSQKAVDPRGAPAWSGPDSAIVEVVGH
jgi:alpha-D-xyloside xylohydrolase